MRQIGTPSTDSMRKEDTMRLHPAIIALALATLIGTPSQATTGPGAVCAALKEKAVGKDVYDQMKCQATAARRDTLDLSCIERAEGRLAASFSKAEGAGGCQTVGDTDPLGEQVNEFVSSAVVALPPIRPTTTTTLPPPCPGGADLISGGPGGTFDRNCWYMGAFGQSCSQVCAAVGRVYNPVTATYAGSDGRDVDCLVTLTSLTALRPDLVNIVFIGRSQDCAADGLPGIGCFIKTAPAGGGGLGGFGRCATPPTTENASSPEYARMCACQ